MAVHKIEKILWLNVSIDDDKPKIADVELKFEHGTDKNLIITILEEALRQVKSGSNIEHTHEDMN